MNVWPFLIDPETLERIVRKIGWLLVHSVWQFTIVAMVTWLLLTYMRHTSAIVRYRMLLVSLLFMVFAPAITWTAMPTHQGTSNSIASVPFTSSNVDGSDLPVTYSTPTATSPNRSAKGRDPDRAANFAANEFRTHASTPAVTSIRPLRDRVTTLVAPWLPTLVGFWSAGVILFSIRPTWSWWTVYRLSRDGALPTPSIAHEALQRAATRIGLTRRVKLQVSSLVTSPIVMGCWQSLILIPASVASSIPVSQLEAIVAHELAHVARHDYLVNFFQTLVETVFFYHPGVWWVSHQIREEREACCDDLVVSRLGNRIEYGRALLAVEELCKAHRSPLAMNVKGGTLLARVQRLLGPPVHQTNVASITLTTLLCSGMLLFVSWIFLSMNRLQGELRANENPLANRVASTEGPSPALGNLPFRLRDHWITEDFRWTDDDTQLVTVTLQGGVNVRRWDLATRQLLSEIKLQSDQHGRPIEQGTIQLSPDAKRVFGVTDAYVGVWDATTGELLRQLPIPRKEWAYDTVRAIGSSYDGSIIVAGLETSFSRLTLDYPTYGIVWNSTTGEIISRFEDGSGFELADIAISADGKQFVTCSRGQRIAVWETSSGRMLKDLTSLARDWKSSDSQVINNNLVSGIEVTRDGHTLAIAGTFGLRLADLTTGKLLRTIDAPYRYGSADVFFSDDGRQLARTGVKPRENEPYSVGIWSAETGAALKSIESSAPIARFSAGGAFLALGESDFYEAIVICPLSGDELTIVPPPPQAYERLDRVEENTHRRGESAQKFVDRWSVQWGPSQAGLQYGLTLTTLGEPAADSFSIGQRVRMATFLKNTSDKPIQFDLRPDMFGNLPQIVGGDGQAVALERQKLVGRVSHYRDQLEPGEVFGPLYLQLALGSNPAPNRQAWTPWWPSPATGRYTAMHRIQLHVADPVVQGHVDQPGWKRAELSSGAVGFEVGEASEASSGAHTGPRDSSSNPTLNATSVSGIVVDEKGQPVPHCEVGYPGATIVRTDVQGQFRYAGGPADQFVLRVYHPDYRTVHASVRRGRGIHVGLRKKSPIPSVDGARHLPVTVIDSRTGEPVPHVKVTATRWEGPRNKEVAGTATTDKQGHALLQGLDFIQHELRLSAGQPLPYAGTSAYPGADEEHVVMLVDRVCDLVLRAVDSETGKGIAGVTFARERAAGELWMQPIENDGLGHRTDEDEATDKDGYFRRQVSAETWSYMVSRFPEGYDTIVPIDGRQEVELDTPVGGRQEYAFRLAKSSSKKAGK